MQQVDLESSECHRDPPRANSSEMALGMKAGKTLRAAPGSSPLCKPPLWSLLLMERQLGELCAHGRGTWWSGSEEGACSPASLYPPGPPECSGLSLPPRKTLIPL